MNLTDLDKLMPTLQTQASVTGWLCLFVAALFLCIFALGIYLIRFFVKSNNKQDERFVLFFGMICSILGSIGFTLLFVSGLPRVINPAFYALEYFKTAGGKF